MPLQMVDSFVRPGILLAKDNGINRLDVTHPGGMTRVHLFKGGSTNNSEIGVDADCGGFWACEHSEIWRFDRDGRGEIALRPLKLAGIPPGANEINWVLRPSPIEPALFFTVFAQRPSVTPKNDTFLARLDLQQKTMTAIQAWANQGIAIDFRTSTVYAPHLGGHETLGILSFDGKSRDVGTGGCFCCASLSPDGKRLVLSGSDLDDETMVSILDLESERIVSSPVPGSNAVWTSRGEIFFLRGEMTLWHLDPESGNVENVISRPGTATRARDKESGRGSFAVTPVPSRDGSFLAWRWYAFDQEKLTHGTVLIDLLRNEARELPVWHHNVAWL